METIDDEWESFLQNDGDDLTGDIEILSENIISENNISDFQSNDVNSIPKCSPIYISTKTKIAYLTDHIDLNECFWKINVIPYGTQDEGVVKKQMKFNFTDEEDVLSMQEKLKCEDYYNDQILFVKTLPKKIQNSLT